MTRYGLREDQWERIEKLLRGESAMSASPPKTTAALSRRFSIATAPGYPGVTSRSDSVIGNTPTGGQPLGEGRGMGTGV